MNDAREQPAPAGEPIRFFGTERLLAFSDGIFAIAITLLILEISVPEVKHDLLGALADLWPSYLSYALSFAFIGIIWTQHHQLYQHITRTDHLFLLINVLFLMWVALIPFPTALLAAYLDDPAGRTTAMAVYAGVFFVGALIFNLLWRYAARDNRLIDDGADRIAIANTNRSYALGPLLYGADFALVFISVPAGLAFFILIALLYAVAPLPAFQRRFSGFRGLE